MNKLQERVGSAKGFIADVMMEMKKTSWPTRQELMSSTVMVIVSVVLVSAFVGISDKLLATLLKLLIPSG